MDLDYVRKLFAYDNWANRQALASLAAMPAPTARSIQLMAHIVGTEWLWHSRLLSRPAAVAVWPDLGLANCEQHLAKLQQAWREYLDGLDSGKLESTVNYRNTKGEDWTNTVCDILMHVVMHGVYHRGQIAAQVRAAGGTPAYSDFIEGVRRRQFRCNHRHPRNRGDRVIE